MEPSLDAASALADPRNYVRVQEATQWFWLRGTTQHACGALVFVLVLIASSEILNAAVLFYEPFSYADGPLVPQSAGRWTAHSGSDDDIKVAASRVFLRKDTKMKQAKGLLDLPKPIAAYFTADEVGGRPFPNVSLKTPS